jgi:hypothetical protein
MELSKVIVVQEPGQAYASAIRATPGAVAAGNVSLSLFNPAANTLRCYIKRVQINVIFTGTVAASLVSFLMRRYTHATGYTGGAVITPAQLNPQTPATSMAQRQASTGGLTDPGVVVGPTILAVGIPNQLVSPGTFDFNFEDTPLVISPGSGIDIVAESAVLASTTIDGMIRWVESP